MKNHFLVFVLFGFSTAVLAQKTTYDSLFQVARHSADRAVKSRALFEAGFALVAWKPFPGDSVAAFTGHLKNIFPGKNLPEDVQALVLLLESKAALTSGEHESGLMKAQAAKKTFEKTGAQRALTAANRLIIHCYSALGQAAEAIQLAQDVLEAATAARDTPLIADMYMALGHDMVTTRQFDEAEDYHRQALALCRNDASKVALVQFHLGNLYLHSARFDSAAVIFEKAVSGYHLVGDSAGASVTAMQLCSVWIMLQKPEKAEPWCEMAMQYFDHNPDQYRRAIALTYMAQQKTLEGKFEQAVEYAGKAREVGEKTNNPDILVKTHMILANAFSALGDWQKAYEHLDRSTLLNDSLRTAAWNQQVTETEARFRTREQKAVIAGQQLELEREKNRRQNLILACVAVLLLLGGGFVWQRARQRHRARETEHALTLEYARAEKHAENDRMKSTFLANISHEFRTPLTLIIAPLQEMRAGTFRGDPRQYFGVMERNAQRLLQLVNQLLDLARLESGGMKLQKRPGDLIKFLRPLAWSFESLAGQKQIRYRIELPEQPVFAHFDRDKLEKIVLNLLSNAFKFTPESGEIGFAAGIEFPSGDGSENFQPTQQAPLAVLKISDTGAGLSPDHLPRIFDRFYRVETDGNIEQTGSGIGLALTKELVGLHGGDVRVQSPDPATGKGSVFTVVLPLDPAESVEAEEGVADAGRPDFIRAAGSAVSGISGNTAEAPERSPRPCILIVEDNPDVREYIAGRMRDRFDILESGNGREGLEAAFGRMPDLILSDIMMPGMDGLAFLEILKNDPRTSHIPVVLLTAKAGLDNRLEGLETGADAYLEKPFDARELDVTVSGLLQKQQVLREKYSRSFRLVPEKTEARSAEEKFLLRIKNLIEENMDDEALSVETIAAAAALSRTHLYRKLQALTGKSPNVLIREMRLERARQLLEQGVGNASEVAFQVGFNSLAYFSKCFAEQFGLSPSEVLRTRVLKPA